MALAPRAAARCAPARRRLPAAAAAAGAAAGAVAGAALAALEPRAAALARGAWPTAAPGGRPERRPAPRPPPGASAAGRGDAAGRCVAGAALAPGCAGRAPAWRRRRPGGGGPGAPGAARGRRPERSARAAFGTPEPPVWEALVAAPGVALNAASDPALRSLVWLDFRLAVAFFVVAPLLLLGAGVVASAQSGAKDDDVLRVTSGYWQASSLLLITVMLNIAGLPIGALTAFAAQLLIPLSLWFWDDLNLAIAGGGGALRAGFQAWRWVATLVGVAGAATQVPFLRCAAAAEPGALRGDAECAAWLEPPTLFRDLLAPWLSDDVAAQAGLLGLLTYCSYALYLVAVILPRTGRRGLAVRPGFTWLAPLQWLGLASTD